MRIPLILAALLLCANTHEKLPSLSHFERAELPEATLLNVEQFGQKITANYPIPVLRQNVTGTAKVNVLVTTKGRAVQCKIKRTSGSAIIDGWACRGTERYARFAPAKSEDGSPTLGQWTQEFTLTLGNPEVDEEESSAH